MSDDRNLLGDALSRAAREALTRREVLVTSLAVGFAAAVRPVYAAAIATNANGLVAGEVRIPALGGELPAYRAMPEAGGPFPVVLVVQEIFGVHEHIKDVCRRLAKEGTLAVAPELYAREGDVSKLTDIQQILSVVARVPDAQVLADLDATLAWASASGKGDATRAAVTGFCWGGRITWLYAAHNPRLRAGVAWYGRLASPPTPRQPKSPLDVAPALEVPVLGLYGGRDEGIPLADVEKLRAALRAAGKSKSEIKVYPDAPHGFNADYRPSYREADAQAAWGEMLAWFRLHGA
jgi:carboxymethylenebutenolidase